MTVVLVALILGALIAFYFYLTRNYKYWQKRGIPSVDGALPGFGNMLSVILMKTDLSELCSKIYNDNKGRSMVGLYDFMSPALMILEPELVKTITQTNYSSFAKNAIDINPDLDPLLAHNPFVLTGEKWVHNRKRLSYAFSSMRLKSLLESVKQVCTTFENYMNEKLNNNQTEFELKSLFARYTAQVVAAAGFGVDGFCFDDEKKDMSFRKIGQAIFEPSLRNSIVFVVTFLMPSLNKIFKLGIVPKHVDNFFRTLVAELMEQRRKDGIPRNDFLHLMVEQERAEDDKFDLEMITAHAMSFIIDGCETTSSVMSFIGFDLARHPEIQNKLREEVLSVLNKYNGEITYEGLKEMTYMDQVLNETLRLLPAGLIIKKRCTEVFELKGSDGIVCRVEPGMEIIIPVQGLQKDPQYWENPEEYDPERFSSDRKHSIDRFVFLPFGGGPRACVGMRMAQLQIKAVLTVILRKYRMELSPKTQIPLKIIPGNVLPTPQGGLWALNVNIFFVINFFLAFSKRCMEEFELIGSGGVVCRVQPGMEILIPFQVLHTDPQYWENPEKYDPERFNSDRKHNIEKFTFLPFGEGPRICVDIRMAQLQIKAGLAIILKKYRMELSPRTQIPLKMILGTFLPTPKAFYFYLMRNYKYWQKRGVPYVDGALPWFGNMLSVICMKTHIADFCYKIYKENKDHSMVGIYDFTSPALIVIEPALVKVILQTNFSSFAKNAIHIDKESDNLLSYNPFVLSGEKWLNSRKRLTCAFSSMRLKILLVSVKKVCATMENYMDRKLSNRETEFELKSLFSKYSAQVVAAAGFGVDGYCFDDNKKDVSFRKLGQAIFKPSKRNIIMFALVFLIPSLNKIFKISFIPKHVENFFRTLVTELMEQRRKDGIPRNDFLHLMAELERAEGDKFDNEMLTGQAMSFVLDGYETSSSVMSFIGFDLARHPEIQNKLREEVLSVLNKYNGEITYEGLKEMTYMDQVLNETLRLLPAGLIIKKRCTEVFELKGSDGIVCRVEPGMEIFIPVQALHKDPQYWENPEEYDPERFNSDRKHNIDRFTFLPFGEGPRICVGMRMAQLQIKAGLAMIIRKYNLELSPKTQMPLKFFPGTILPTPKGGLWAYFRQL
ncbi:CP6J1 protein, partial [Pseudoatta argentina]